MFYVFLCFIFFSLTSSEPNTIEMSPTTDDPWDLDGPCQIYVEKFAIVQSEMVRCASNWSIPPKVCTNCFSQYINFKQVEWETKNLNHVFSLDNRTCSQVIYDNYLLSYSTDISVALTQRIWEQSRCDSCLKINWDFEKNSSGVVFNDRTLQFQSKLYDWRNCVVNYTSGDIFEDISNETQICSLCNSTFDDLFNFYWNIYIDPTTDFCVDVETTMNDTLHLWNDVWKCAERQDRNRDLVSVLITLCVLLVLTALFYTATFIQGGGKARNLIRYSRMAPPRGTRSRLLTGSSEAHFGSSYSTVNTFPPISSS
ncbi:unnamed protein product [Caenorhabditis auriculariae]|uniref:Osteopetrosis-associated transmembrane protein 1 n=1 Tax=Caenorhabditis auriculariae TaxID=2777116 RepID=A0A8S1HR58_9PELO|nr:unnamed protein product [Caenorhabditis auriculariae]